MAGGDGELREIAMVFPHRRCEIGPDGVGHAVVAGLEVALRQEAGLIRSNTTIVTVVNDRQVVDDDLPETEHDFSVDLIVTPAEVISCGPSRRPVGLIWDHLTPEKIAAIPVLAAMSSSRPAK
ncbi:hypothetical protein [Kutzneria chonburiensis]|uniref:Uncharacterized protein n=1 Tax=Kutzneria chonburiensis TaxID=1483604 RepID=A0ABV6MQ02_9PSEU|nr:hypothetical protein [Kutzneria chonburiensis]